MYESEEKWGRGLGVLVFKHLINNNSILFSVLLFPDSSISLPSLFSCPQYFHGHRFRGRALLDFGEPIEVSQELLAAYKAGGAAKRDACNQLLDTAKQALAAVTVSAPDYETLRVLWAARRLYKPQHVRLTLDQTHHLTQRFAEAYTALKDVPEMQQLRSQIEEYNLQLETFGLRDHQVVATSQRSRAAVWARLLLVTAVAIIESVLLLPFFILGIPILVICRIVSHAKARAAVASSTVKQKGLDVVGTWKLLTSLAVVPITFTLYAFLAGLVFGARIGFAMWFLLPCIMLASLRLWDHYLRVLRALWSLVFILRRPEQGSNLYAMRKQIKAAIREFSSQVAEKLNIQRMFTEADFVGEEDAEEEVPANGSKEHAE